MPRHTSEIVRQVFPLLNGAELFDGLVDFASINGTLLPPTPDLPVRYATNRIALSDADQAGRKHIIDLMKRAGLDVDDSHPFMTSGKMHGKNPKLPSIATGSHIDTVKDGDMFDGTTGALGSIMVASALNQIGYVPEQGIDFKIFTGEESAAFKYVLFGSRSLTFGIPDEGLDSTNDAGVSMREILGSEARIAMVQKPYYGSGPDQHPLPGAWIEWHIEQGPILDQGGYDIATVNAIAAPMRNELIVGDTTLTPHPETLPFVEYLELSVAGKADHSGATKMGKEHRADGLVETARIGRALLDSWPETGAQLEIGDIHIEGQAVSKVPGNVITKIRLQGNTASEIKIAMKQLKKCADEINQVHNESGDLFDENPITITKIGEPDESLFYDPEIMQDRQRVAFDIISETEQAGENRAKQNVVATIGTYNQSGGKITVLRDVRGVDRESRNATISELSTHLDILRQRAAINSDRQLPGSTDPVAMDPRLVKISEQVIKEYQIGRSITMFSAAIHDSHNFASLGIPTVMLFTPSRNGSHNPNCSTTPEALGVGLRGLAALLVELTSGYRSLR